MRHYKLVILVLIVITQFNLTQLRLIDDRLENSNNRSNLHNLHNSTSPFDLINLPSKSLIFIASNERQDLSNSFDTANKNLEIEINNNPTTCKQANRKKLEDQPVANELSRVKKCCPIGQSLYIRNREMICDTEKYPFKIEPVTVELYDNCIEDLEKQTQLEIFVGKACTESYIYTKSGGDQIFVIQDGSLLAMDENGALSYEINPDYCLDISHANGDLMAYMCLTPIESNSRSLHIVFIIHITIFTLFAIVVGKFVVFIKRLNKRHIMILSLASINAVITYSLHIYAVLSPNNNLVLGDFIKYLILLYYGCYLIQCLGLLLIVIVCNFWPTCPCGNWRCCKILLAAYATIAIVKPIMLVLSTQHEKISDMSLFSYQAMGDSTWVSQRFFVLLVSLFIGIGFISLIVAYYNSYKFENISILVAQAYCLAQTTEHTEDESPTTNTFDEDFLIATEKDVQCFLALTCIILSDWVLALATFFIPDTSSYMQVVIVPIIVLLIIGLRQRDNVKNLFTPNRSQENQRNLPIEMEEMNHGKNGDAMENGV